MTASPLQILVLFCALFWLLPLWRSRQAPTGSQLAAPLLLLALVHLVWLALLLRPPMLSAPAWLLLNHLAEAGRLVSWWWLLNRLLAGGQAHLSAARVRVATVLLACVMLVVYNGSASLLHWPPLDKRIAFASFWCAALVPLVLAEQLFRGAERDQRWALKFLLLAVVISSLLDLLLYGQALVVGRIDGDIWLSRAPATVLIAILTTIGAGRLLPMRSGLSLSHRAVFYTGTLMFATLAILVALSGGWYIRARQGEWSVVLAALFVLLVLAVLVLLVASGRFRAWLKVFLSQHFLPYRYDHREQWLLLTDRLAEGVASNTLPRAIVQALAAILESPGGWLWLRDGNQLTCLHAENRPLLAPLILSAETWHELDSLWLINSDDQRPADAWLAAMDGAWMAIPLNDSEGCIALVVLAYPHVRRRLDWEDHDLLKVAARHAGAVLAQQRSNQALVEAQQFSALHQSTAFLAHDMKTMIAQLSMLEKNADRHRHNPAFIDDMLATVHHSVEKMTHIVQQLRQPQLATHSGQSEPIELSALLAQLCQRLARFSPAPQLLPVAEAITLYLPRSPLEMALGHLLRNAQEACQQGGDIMVSYRRQEDGVAIDIKDSGEGMTAAFIRDHLFRPFHSTKGVSGMGIGAFQSRALLQQLGGRLTVQSEVGVGSHFSVWLPLREVESQTREGD